MTQVPAAPAAQRARKTAASPLAVMLSIALVLCMGQNGAAAGELRPRTHVMIMTHSRPAEVRRLLQFVGNGSSYQHIPHEERDQYVQTRVHVVVSQSCTSPGDAVVGEMASVISRTRRLFASLAHVLTPVIPDDASFTLNAKFGNKRNSVNNLLHGLDVAFTGAHTPPLPFPPSFGSKWLAPSSQATVIQELQSGGEGVHTVIVLEDDVTLSTDFFAFMSFAAWYMRTQPEVQFASGVGVWRPSVLVGNDDMSRVEAWMRYKHGVEHGGDVVELVNGTPRTVFKTLAWCLSAAGFHSLRTGLAGVVADAMPLTLQSRTGRVEPGDGGSVAPVPRTSHNQLQGCIWCHDYCYDHVIEWALQGKPYLVPAIPRVTQVRGSGMTSAENEVTEIYAPATPGAVTRFVVDSTRALAFSLFVNHGASARAPARDASLLDGPLETVAAYASEPLLHAAVGFVLLVALLVAVAVAVGRGKRGSGRKGGGGGNSHGGGIGATSLRLAAFAGAEGVKDD